MSAIRGNGLASNSGKQGVAPLKGEEQTQKGSRSGLPSCKSPFLNLPNLARRSLGVTAQLYNKEDGGLPLRQQLLEPFVTSNFQSLLSLKGTLHPVPAPPIVPLPHLAISLGRRPSSLSRELVLLKAKRQPQDFKDTGLHIPLPYNPGRRENSGNLTLVTIISSEELAF